MRLLAGFGAALIVASYWWGGWLVLVGCGLLATAVALANAHRTDALNEREQALDQRQADLEAVARRIVQARGSARRTEIVVPRLPRRDPAS